MAHILGLFDDATWQSLVSNPCQRVPADAESHPVAVATAGDIAQRLTPSDCCAGCEFLGLCDSDECAAKLYPIDDPFPFTLFPNLGVYVQFLKSHGWL